MFFPRLSSWVEKRDTRSSFRGGHSCRFVLMAVAVPAGQAQIIKHIATFGVDMVNLHRLSDIRFAGLAVFAASPGAFVNQSPNRAPRKFTHAVV